MKRTNGLASALALVLGLGLVACGDAGDGGTTETDSGAAETAPATDEASPDAPAGETASTDAPAGEAATEAATETADAPAETVQDEAAPADEKWAAYTKVLPFVVGSEAGLEAAAAADKAAMLFLTATW